MRDFSGLQLAFDIGQFLLTGAIGVYVYLSNKNRVTHTRITKLEEKVDKRMDEHSTRLTQVETHIEHLPKDEDLTTVRTLVGEVGAVVERLRGEVHGLKDALAPMRAQLTTVYEFLLKAKIER